MEYDSFQVGYEIYNGKFWKYLIYPSDEYDEWAGKYNGDYEAEHREIFSDEIIIETDMSSKRLNRIFADKLTKRLRINGFGYRKWDSGNKSKHIQIFFPQLRQIHSSDLRKRFKEIFIMWLMGCKRNYPSCSYCDGARSRKGEIDCPVVIKNIDTQLTGKHMIRMEYAIHPKTNKRKILEEEYGIDESNIMPKWVIDRVKKVHQKRKDFKIGQIKCITDMMCFHYWLNKGVQDCRERIAFSLSGYLVKVKGAQEARDILHSWNKKILNGYLRDSVIEGKIRGAVKSDRTTGCSFNRGLLRELGLMSICNYCKYKTRLNNEGISNN